MINVRSHFTIFFKYSFLIRRITIIKSIQTQDYRNDYYANNTHFHIRVINPIMGITLSIFFFENNNNMETLKMHLNSMRFSLIMPKTETLSNLQRYIVYHYTGMLQVLLRKQQIPDFWVTEASIIIGFCANVEKTWLHACSTFGEPFQCRCQITDDTGCSYSSIIGGRCLPHSVMKELKSTQKSTM